MEISLIAQMIIGASQILNSFQGTEEMARTTDYIQDAVGTIVALTPLVKQFGDGKAVTLDDARAALAGMNDALQRLEDEIAAS